MFLGHYNQQARPVWLPLYPACLDFVADVSLWDDVCQIGFFVVYKFFGLSPEASLADLEEAGRAFCSRNWAEVQVKLGHERRLEEYCFR